MAQTVTTGHETEHDRSVRWWFAADDEMGRQVEATYREIRNCQGDLSTRNQRHMQLYRNTPMLGLGNVSEALRSLGLERLSLNVIRNMCSTVTSKISKNRPRAQYQTSGAGPETRRKARLLERFTDGVFYEQRVYEKTPRVFLDCVIFGTGVVKVTRERGRVVIERVFPPEITVDDAEGMHQDPRNIYQVKYLDKGVVKARWKDKAEEIDKIETPVADNETDAWWMFTERSKADMVRVVEAYHRESWPGAGDGKYCIEAGGVTLESGAWNHDYLPYVFIRWNPGHVGFWGMGLAEELHGIQAEINRLVRKIQTAMSLLANPYVMIRRSAAVAKSKLTDIPGTILEYNDVEPRVQAPATVNQEVFGHLDRLYQRAYEIAGVSQLSAQSQKPTGFDSGRAMLVHQDIESDRFSMVTREWDNLHMEIARLSVRVASQIKGYKVKAFGEEGFDEISFSKDIDLDEDSWVIQVMPVSFLPKTSAGQLDFIERMQKLGLMTDPDEFVDQFQGPDVETFVRRKTSARRTVERLVEKMLDGGEFVAPEPHMNLAQAISIAQEMYNEAWTSEAATEESLGNVRQFMRQCMRLEKGLPSGAPPLPPGAPPMGPPGAAIPLPIPPPGMGPNVGPPAGPIPMPPGA